ncbi:MAG: hydrogen gas-evolving membrane-bound hydrogenase subunit E [Thermoleophilaceae bacterium]
MASTDPAGRSRRRVGGLSRAALGCLTATSPAALLAIAIAASGFVATLVLWSAGGVRAEVPWAPTLDLRLSFALDGLGALYALLATGIALAVFTYSSRYLPRHLDHQERPRRDERAFYGFLLLFMVSMVGLVTAQDLILLFVFWDLTAIASYYLIAYDSREEEARRAALMALLVTGVSAVLLLIGTLMLYAEYGTFSLPELIERARPGSYLTVAVTLMAVAGLAKSAQVPLHFWLPRAMAAPTPVSAYLHSAAMVAAGVFLLGRLYPLLALSQPVLDGLLLVGAASMVVGGILALTRQRLKQLLAYSTISQYGYVVFMYGLGGEKGVVAAAFYVLAHALAKSALFLTAGAVTEATGGETRLSHLGGLARSMPALAVGSGVAAAALAALPLTLGFFKDELFFKAALARGSGFALLAVLGAALTVAYIGRLWLGVFLGPRRTDAERLSPAFSVPVVGLAALLAVGGVLVGPFEGLAEAAGAATLNAPTPAEAAYHLDLRAENLMALAAYALGGLLLVRRGLWIRTAGAVASLGERVGPERAYNGLLRGLNALSDRAHDIEVRDLRTRVAAVLVPCGVLVLLGFAATPTEGAFAVGDLSVVDIPLALALGVAAVAAVAATIPRDHLTMVLVLSASGFSLAVAYAFFGGPDVALVAVLIEILFALLFLGLFSLLPPEVLRRESQLKASRARAWRDASIAVVSGAFALAVVWAALSRPAVGQSVAADQLRLAPAAHGKDVVTVILTDFRGLDTLGEITVLAIALLGTLTLLGAGRLR